MRSKIISQLWLYMIAASIMLALTQQATAETSNHSLAAIGAFIRSAIANDQRIGKAQAQLQSSEAGVDAANAPRKPQLNLSGSSSWNNNVKPTESNFNNTELSLNIEQSLWQRNQISKRNLAELDIQNAELGIAQAHQQLYVELGTVFFTLLTQQSVVAAYERQLKSLDNAVKRERVRYQTGVSSKPQLLAALAEYNQINANLITASAQESIYFDSLERITGIPVQLPEVKPQPDIAMPSGTWQEWEKLAKQHNLNLERARTAIEQEDINLTLAQRSRDLTIGLFGRWNRSTNPQGLKNESEHQQVGLSVTVPLYSGGSSSAATSRAEQQLVASQLERDYQDSLLSFNLKLHWRGLESQLTIIEANKLSLESASQLLEVNKTAYANKVLNQQDLLDAQTRFYDASRQLASAQYAFSLKLINFFALVGMLDNQRFLDIAASWL